MSTTPESSPSSRINNTKRYITLSIISSAILLFGILDYRFSKVLQFNIHSTTSINTASISRVVRRRKYSILPQKQYSVFGLESSGTQFVTGVIRDALQLQAYREGSEHYWKQNEISMEHSDIQAQHFSLPWGLWCSSPDVSHPLPIVDVVLPAQCSKPIKTKIEIEECDSITQELWGFRLKDKKLKYPQRYQMDIVSHKKWYDEQGVDQYVIIVVRDPSISAAARNKVHCTDKELIEQEDQTGTDMILHAINTFIIQDDEEKLENNEQSYKHWYAKQFQKLPPSQDDNSINNDNEQQQQQQQQQYRQLEMLGFLPSSTNINSSGGKVVVVSYETMMKLGQVYVKMLYDALDIQSDHAPRMKDGNAKYVA